MGKPSAVKDKLAAKAETGIRAANAPKTIEEYIHDMGPAIRQALPKHMDPDRLARVALTVIRTSPVLKQCTVPSLLAAILQAAQLGLEPGLLGHCYFVPFRNSKTGLHEVQFIIGYKGLIDLARRSGNIESIAAHEVCENDEFEFEYGLEEKLRHKPALQGRGKPYLYYAYAKFQGGGHQIEVMSVEEIEKIRKRSKAADKGPWVTDYDEMAKKTVVRRLAKYLPISVEIMRGLAQDETVKTDFSADMTEVPDISEQIIDGEVTEVPEDTPADDVPIDGNTTASGEEQTNSIEHQELNVE